MKEKTQNMSTSSLRINILSQIFMREMTTSERIVTMIVLTQIEKTMKTMTIPPLTVLKIMKVVSMTMTWTMERKNQMRWSLMRKKELFRSITENNSLTRFLRGTIQAN